MKSIEAAAAVAAPATIAAALDLTAVWQRCHPHLIPDAAHAPLPAAQYGACDFCSGPRSFEVAAHVRYGADAWVHETRLRHCPDCGRFVLAGATRAAHQISQPELAGLDVTAVDARLWSANPTFLNIEPTTRCNFNCWYCVGRHMVQADIEVDNFARLLAKLPPSVKAIALVGEGEPLLHKGFFDMANMARDQGIRVLMVSNGSAFSESVVRKLCEAEVAYVSVSVDSVDPATFAQSRLDGDLARVWEGITKLRRYRDDNGYKYPKIGIKGTLFTHTEDELIAIVEEAKRRGADLLENFQPLNPKTSYVRIYPKSELPQLDKAEGVSRRIVQQHDLAAQGMEHVMDFCAAEGIPVSNTGRPNGMRPGCDEEWLYSLLSGDVTPCCQVKDVLDPNWNIFERTLDEVLGDPHYERVRFNLWNGLFPDYCQGCFKTKAA